MTGDSGKIFMLMFAPGRTDSHGTKRMTCYDIRLLRIRPWYYCKMPFDLMSAEYSTLSELPPAAVFATDCHFSCPYYGNELLVQSALGDEYLSTKSRSVMLSIFLSIDGSVWKYPH